MLISEIKSFFAEASVNVEAPGLLFHGTFGENADKILEDGEIIAGKTRYKGALAPRPGRIYLSKEIGVAEFMAVQSMHRSGRYGTPIVFIVHETSLTDVQADEDDVMVMLDAYFNDAGNFHDVFEVFEAHGLDEQRDKYLAMDKKKRVAFAKSFLDSVTSSSEHAIIVGRSTSISAASPAKWMDAVKSNNKGKYVSVVK